MTMLLIDGFDHLDIVDVWTISTGNNVTTTNPSPRTGSHSLAMGISGLAYRALSPSEVDDQATIGAGVWMGSTNIDAVRVMAHRYFEVGGTNHIEVRVYPPARSIRVVRAGGTFDEVVIAESEPNVVTWDVWHYIESQVRIADSGGSVEVRLNGVTVLTHTGDTRHGGSGIISGLGIVGNGFSAQGCFFDDVYMLNEQGAAPWNTFLGDTRVYPLYPMGNGFYSLLDGSDGNSTNNFELVDEQGAPITTDYVGSITDGEIDTYAFQNITDFQNLGTIAAVESRIHAAKTETGTKQMRLVVRRGGADAFGPDHILAKDDFSTYRYLMQQDPHAGPGAWSLGNVDNTEFGVEVRP